MVALTLGIRLQVSDYLNFVHTVFHLAIIHKFLYASASVAVVVIYLFILSLFVLFFFGGGGGKP